MIPPQIGYNPAVLSRETLAEVMSAVALKVYEALRASGIDESRARVAAEAIDRNTAEQIVASEEKAAEKFVAKDAYAARMEQTPTRDEARSEYAKLREDIKDLREDIKTLREEMRAGFQRCDRFFIAIVVTIVAFALRDIFLGG